jgi:LuxR family maltose regulon positive regulatory protein
MLRRERLVERLRAERAAAVVALAAPAGFGKSTVLAQWAAAEERPVAWIPLGPEHDDAVVLIEDVAAALAEAAAIDPGLSGMYASLRPPVSTRILPRLARALRGADTPFLLVLDDAHVITSAKALEVLSVLATSVGAGSQVALGARAVPDIHASMLRAEGRLATIGPAELAFDQVEVGEVLRASGAPADLEAIRAIAQVTEGWPVGVRLAAGALQERWPSQEDQPFSGEHHLVVDYVREELLGQQPSEVADFLLDTSVLERLSAARCDALLERGDSALVLDRLAREQMLLTPLDPRHEWFRYHQLFADALHAELERRDPARARELHRRACDVLASEGEGDAAVRHALLAGDRPAAAGLVWRLLPAYISAGRADTVRRWLDRFDPAERERDPHLALAHAWLHVETRSDLVGHWAGVAERCDHDGPLSDEESLEAAVRVLRATIGADGVEAMGREAALAFDEIPEGSPWRSLCRFFEGASLHLRDHPEEARARLEEGALRAGADYATVSVLCVSWLGAMDVLAGDWEGAAPSAERALAVMRESGLDEYGSAAIAVALAAAVSAHEDRHEEARRHQAHARRLVAVIEGVAPFFAASIRALLVRASLRIGDPLTAAVMLEEGEASLRDLPDAPVLAREYADLRTALAAVPRGALDGPGALTSAEMRILRFLPTHLSFREIGERLHVSRFTVKSQAMAVYRKLGVTSRSEAVARAGEMGLIDP